MGECYPGNKMFKLAREQVYCIFLKFIFMQDWISEGVNFEIYHFLGLDWCLEGSHSWSRAVWLQEIWGDASKGDNVWVKDPHLRSFLACQQAEMCVFQFLLRMGNKNLGVLEVTGQKWSAIAMTLWENHWRGKTWSLQETDQFWTTAAPGILAVQSPELLTEVGIMDKEYDY